LARNLYDQERDSIPDLETIQCPTRVLFGELDFEDFHEVRKVDVATAIRPAVGQLM